MRLILIKIISIAITLILITILKKKIFLKIKEKKNFYILELYLFI